jgi:hypothetical protein
MSDWRTFVYFLPDDRGATLDHFLDSLPAELGSRITCLPLGDFRLQVLHPAAAVFLAMAVVGVTVADHQHPFLDPGDLHVPGWLRPQCEQELATRCGSTAAWQELVSAEFRTEDARSEFERALGALIGEGRQ